MNFTFLHKTKPRGQIIRENDNKFERLFDTSVVTDIERSPIIFTINLKCMARKGRVSNQTDQDKVQQLGLGQ